MTTRDTGLRHFKSSLSLVPSATAMPKQFLFTGSHAQQELTELLSEPASKLDESGGCAKFFYSNFFSHFTFDYNGMRSSKRQVTFLLLIFLLKCFPKFITII